MLTLAQAFRLCGIKDEGITIKTRDRPGGEWVWSRAITNRFDLKKVYVTKIDTEFSYDGEYYGFSFSVVGLTTKDIKEACDRWSRRRR